MKLTLAVMLTSLFVLIGTNSSAQSMWGVKGGLGLTRVVQTNCRVDEEPCNLDNKTGVIGGLFANLAPGSGTYGFQPEVLFAMKGGKRVSGNKVDVNKINYLEIPLLGRVSPKLGSVNPFIVVGPSVGLRLSATDTAGNDVKDDFKSVEFGLIIAGGVTFTKVVGVEARFEESLADQLTDTGRQAFGLTSEVDKKTNNRTIALLVDINLGK